MSRATHSRTTPSRGPADRPNYIPTNRVTARFGFPIYRGPRNIHWAKNGNGVWTKICPGLDGAICNRVSKKGHCGDCNDKKARLVASRSTARTRSVTTPQLPMTAEMLERLLVEKKVKVKIQTTMEVIPL